MGALGTAALGWLFAHAVSLSLLGADAAVIPNLMSSVCALACAAAVLIALVGLAATGAGQPATVNRVETAARSGVGGRVLLAAPVLSVVAELAADHQLLAHRPLPPVATFTGVVVVHTAAAVVSLLVWRWMACAVVAFAEVRTWSGFPVVDQRRAWDVFSVPRRAGSGASSGRSPPESFTFTAA